MEKEIGDITGMSPAELQYVVNCSDFWLHMHSAILYGFMEGQLPNQENCIKWIEAGKTVGVLPEKDFIPPDFKLLNKVPGANEYCEKCRKNTRHKFKQGVLTCMHCHTQLN